MDSKVKVDLNSAMEGSSRPLTIICLSQVTTDYLTKLCQMMKVSYCACSSHQLHPILSTPTLQSTYCFSPTLKTLAHCPHSTPSVASSLSFSHAYYYCTVVACTQTFILLLYCGCLHSDIHIIIVLWLLTLRHSYCSVVACSYMYAVWHLATI